MAGEGNDEGSAESDGIIDIVGTMDRVGKSVATTVCPTVGFAVGAEFVGIEDSEG